MNQKPVGKNFELGRRAFLGTAATSAAVILPRHVLGGRGYTAPSDKLNIGCVGIGGKGKSDVKGVASENIAALCDVDDVRGADSYKAFPQAKRYRDFRKMLDAEKNLDAVVVSTPDHNHAAVALRAMQLGKHVYVQKPLTHTIQEARKMTLLAREKKLATQMGNQGHCGEGNRLVCEWIWSGVIGQVHEAHAWTNRPKGYWPQGEQVVRPAEIPSVPSTLDWDVWIGPATFRPYHPVYHPFAWRGWWDFGCGAIGDMACHIVDTPVWALKLGQPTWVQANTTPFNKEAYPLASVVRYQFPAREGMIPVNLTWYDGGLMPARPELLADGIQMGDDDGGVLLVGEKGVLVSGCYGRNPLILLKEGKIDPNAKPPQMIERSPGTYVEWIQACKGGTVPCSNFDVAGPLTEIALLGNLAIRFQDKNSKLLWDGVKMEVTNLPEANAWMVTQNEYRPGWEL